MSDTPDLDRLVARIRKLLALANDARGNENEAANAAALAARLVAEHGLDLAVLEAQNTDAPQGGQRERTQHARAAMYLYQRTLMEGIARNNMCRYWVEETTAHSFGKLRKVKRHTLLGRTINVQATLMVYDYLVSTMDRLLPWQGTALRGKEALAWLSGCAERLVERLNDQRRRMEAEQKAARREAETRARHPGAPPPTPGTALVLSDVFSSEDDYNTDFLNGWEPGTTARERKEREARVAVERAERDARATAAKEAGEPDDVVNLIRQGYDLEIARRVAARRREEEQNAKPETEAQARRRAEREARDNARWQERNRRYWQREDERRDNPAYKMGRRTGDQIGLDPQVTAEQRHRLEG